MFILVLIVHIIVSMGLIGIVLLQAGRGASLSSLFGGGPGEAIFGSGGDIFLKKLTIAFAVIFMITSLSLYIISARQETRSVVSESGRPAIPTSAPVPTPPQPTGQNQGQPAAAQSTPVKLPVQTQQTPAQPSGK